jgi:hypothetical protein
VEDEETVAAAAPARTTPRAKKRMASFMALEAPDAGFEEICGNLSYYSEW